MVKKPLQDSATVKISQYLFAIAVGALAVWLAPQTPVYPPEAARLYPPSPPLDSTILRWWAGLVEPSQTSSSRLSTDPVYPDPIYPWVHHSRGTCHWYHTLTKQDFRCRGKSQHGPISVGEGVHKQILFDCWGDSHGLPWVDGQEFVYPALIEILNQLQQRLQAPVRISSAHRCPAHHRYLTYGQGSEQDRHLIAAAADFYVEGWQEDQQRVLEELQRICLERAPDGQDARWHLQPTSAQSWSNAELELRWYERQQQRCVDNQHPYPFWQILLRYDKAQKKAISFDGERARRLPLR